MTQRVVVADDQALVRTGFRMILSSDPEIEVVGEAADGEQAIALTKELRPDVVLMDIRMPEIDGIEATRRIVRDVSPPPRIIILTTFDLDEYVFDAIAAGASGFLLKDAPATQLITAVQTVAAGDALLAPQITRRLIDEFARARKSRGPTRASPRSPRVSAKSSSYSPRDSPTARSRARSSSRRRRSRPM